MSSILSTKDMQQLRSLLPTLTTTLHNFASSPTSFKLLTTITPSTTFPPSCTASQPSLPPPKTLYILDSSFNPPTLAHARLLTSALSNDNHTPSGPNRLLLLLSIQNADKAPKPASFEQRLIMMTIFARDLQSQITSPQRTSVPSSKHQTEEQQEEPTIDLALTKHPYFHQKSASISESNIYAPGTTQVHLLGYDTLIRLLNTKYYPPEHSLGVLDPFLSRHRLRVTYRGDGGDDLKDKEEKEEQDAYLRDIRDGTRESEGARREWVTKGNIEMVDGRKEGEEVVSSTRVREAVGRGDDELLGKLLTDGVREWILEGGLYLDE